MESFVTTVALCGIVIVVASLLSGTIERSGVPLVAVFLALGALLGPWGLGIADVGFHSPALHALAMLGLALLLFSDAVTLETTELRARRGLLWRLLGPGTLAPAVLTAAAAWLLLDVPLPAAAIVGAALASTDPVLLRTVLRSKALPQTPRIALRLESGMNDVVLLPIVIVSMLLLHMGGPATMDAVARVEFTRSIIGLFVLGPVLGALVGWVGISALAWVRERAGVRRDYESLYALGLAFSSFAAAEAVGGSGFVAAFTAGLLVAVKDIELCDCFLEYGEATAEMLLLLTFVALGTALIWTGLTVINWRTLLFAVVALVARPAVLYPVLGGTELSHRDRRLIAFFGPRGLSSLLLTLLPVFAGVAGSERLFAVTCLVVLMSVALHGGGTALFLRSAASRAAPTPGQVVPAIEKEPDTAVPELITIDELKKLQAAGEPVVIVDARAERNYRTDPVEAVGSVRLQPEDPVRDATAQRLSKRANLVVYCA
jgi:NhaP-type Na+/H+ or K+/H+ antiporter